ncbi:hypothetical protein [Pleionea sp. CnH1-48]|uniref:hypothetical protein n=1 Tax=Pleionea sp. CnH1-48 TaxID=2954494 RepID=UPI002097E018|nr:hypothetical protein [Pleionea sp. CnH1-48]MCO7223643.1 hypothetical protein [Pleionea sp. CnH1-48]
MLKKVALLFGLAFSIHSSYASSNYQQIFDAHDQIRGDWHSNSSNKEDALAWGESYVMMSYMTMYRASGERRYLDKLIRHAENVFAQRDDNAIPQVSGLDGVVRPTWASTRPVTNNKAYSWVGHSGMILYPILDFAQLVKNTPSLGDYIYQADGRSFQTIAAHFVTEAQKTITAHEFQWDNAIGNYRIMTHPQHTLSGQSVPFNMSAAMGRVLLMMYKYTNDTFYLNRVNQLLAHFKEHLTYDASDQSYIWYYGADDANIENSDHAFVEIDFARLCFENNLAVTQDDMNRFASTFTNRIYKKQPGKFYRFLDRTGDIENATAVGRYLSLSTFDPDIYHVIEDVLLEHSLSTPGSFDFGWIILSIAELFQHQNKLHPVATDRSSGSASDYSAITTGDFDGNGIDEFITSRNFDGRLFLRAYNNSQVSTLGSYKDNAIVHWSGLAAGDFIGNGREQLVAVNNDNGNIYLFEVNNNQLLQIATLEQDANSQWAGVAAGNFKGNGKAQFVGFKNSDGNAYMYEYANNQITLIATLENGNASSWAGVAAGDFKNVGKDQFIALRNFDGKGYLYELDNGAITYVATLEAGSASNWTGVAAGNFDNDSEIEIVAHRSFDNDLLFYSYQDGQLVSEGKEYFPGPLNLKNLTLGKLSSASQNGDNLLFIRKTDAHLFMYQPTIK